MNDEGATLYLDGSLNKTNQGTCYAGETQSVLLLCQYCENVFADAVFVSENEIDNKTPDCGIRSYKDCFKIAKQCNTKDLPDQIKSCKLPAVISQDQVCFKLWFCDWDRNSGGYM